MIRKCHQSSYFRSNTLGWGYQRVLISIFRQISRVKLQISEIPQGNPGKINDPGVKFQII
jgi:hypothetical protein